MGIANYEVIIESGEVDLIIGDLKISGSERITELLDAGYMLAIHGLVKEEGVPPRVLLIPTLDKGEDNED